MGRVDILLLCGTCRCSDNICYLLLCVSVVSYVPFLPFRVQMKRGRGPAVAVGVAEGFRSVLVGPSA